MLLFILFFFTSFIKCDDVQIALVINGVNSDSNVVLNQLNSVQCTLNSCQNQFCRGAFELQSQSTSIKTNTLLFPHFQVASVVDVGVTNNVVTTGAIKNIIQLGDDTATGQYTNFSMGDYAGFTVNAACTINSYQLTYFFQVLSILNRGSDKMTTSINDYNTPVHSYIYRYQINVNTCHPTCLLCSGMTSNDCTSCQQIAGISAGTCSCTNPSNYFQNGQCVPSCSTNYVPNGKYCFYNYGCSTPDPSNNGKCQTCAGGFFNNDGVCQTQSNVPPGYVQQGYNFVLNASLNPLQVQNVQQYLKAFTSYTFSDLEITNKGFSVNPPTPQQPQVTSCNGVNILGGFMVIKQNGVIQFPQIKISTQYYQIFFTVYLIDFDNNLSPSYINIILSDGQQQLSSYAVSPNKSTSYYCGLNQQDTIDSFSFVQKIGASSSNIVTKTFQIINKSSISYGNAPTNYGYLGIRDITVIGFDCKESNCKDCSNYVCLTCEQTYFLNPSKQCQSCISNCSLCSDGISCNTCVSGYYADSNQCQKCYDPYCDQCTNSKISGCTNCLQGSPKPYLLVDDNSCTDCNLDGHYKNSFQCSKCIQNCITCSDSSTCSKCSLGYFVNASKQCEKCFDPNCLICSGKNQQDCTSCNSVKPYFLQDDHSCTDCAFNGYFLSSKNCLKCVPNCYNCSNTSTCDLCQPGYQVHEQTNQCVVCSQQSGYYVSGKYCKQCNIACKECSGPSDQDCIICNQLYFQIDTTSKRCQTCPNNAYLISSKQNCQICNYQCIICDNIQSSYSMIKIDQNQNSNQNYCLVCSCQQCVNGYILFNQKQCTQSCDSIGSNYIYNSSTNTCDCQQGYNYQVRNPYKNNFDCSNGQGYGYYCDSRNICLQCSENCSSCSDSLTCTKCNEGSYLWQNACYKNCFPELNIVPNFQTGICECPEGYNLEQLSNPVQGQSTMCQLPLVLQYINIYNYLVQSNDIPLPTDFSQNLIVITYNRMLTSQEYSSFKFLIDKDTLDLGNQYNITSMSMESQNIKAIVTSQQNRKVKQFTISIQGSEINYQIPSTILVSSSYGEQSNSLASSKQLTQNLQTITKAFSPDENTVAGKIITLLKQFQILCYISNFVQVLPMIYLIKEYLPQKVNFASLFGATIVFNQTPPPTQISFESQYLDSSNTQQLKDTLKSFGIKPGIYNNFLCDDVQVALVINGSNSDSNVVLNKLNSVQCTLNSCQNQFCRGAFELQSQITSIKTNTLLFPHFQVASVVDIGVTNNVVTTDAIKNIIQLSDDTTTGQYTNFSMGDYAGFTVNAACTINSYQLTYFFQVLSILNRGSDKMTTSINDYNKPVHSYIYSCQQVAGFTAGQNGQCSCTNPSNYFQNGQCVPSCSINYVPNGKYCYYNQGCSTPDPSNNGKCQTCKGGYFNNDGVCQTQSNVPPGYVQQGNNFLLNASLNPQQVQNIQQYLKAFTSYTFSDLEIANKGFSVNPPTPQQPQVTSCNGVNILGGFMVIKQNGVIQFPQIKISTQYYQIFFTVYLIDFDNNLSPSYINIILSDGQQQLSSYAVSSNKSTSLYCGLNQQDTIDSFSFVQKIGASSSNIITKTFQIINKSSISYGNAPTNYGYLGIRDITVIGFDCKDSNCKDCSNYVCLTCEQTYFLNPSKQCQSCISNCSLCSNGISCNTCVSGYYADSNKQCQKCYDPYCDQCTSSNKSDCTQCLQGSPKPYLLVDDNSCTDCNLDGHYKNSQQCSKCIQNCITCSDSSTCSKCSFGYFVNASKQCEKCFDPNCLICSGKNQQDCTSCNSVKQYFLQDDHSCTDCNLDGYYKNSQQCSKCIQNCITCSDSSTCSNCSPGYFINASSQCEKCFDPNCLICSGKNQQDCTSCNSVKSYFLQDDHSCTDCNLDGYYKNSQQCSKCIQNCITCSDSLTCSKCSPGYFINASNQCEKCFDPNCLICSGKNQQDCTSCNSVKHYFLQDDHSCTDCNLDGYYKNSQQCSKCIQNCITCSDSSKCSKCSLGYFINASNQCEKCFDPNCQICSGKNQQDCTSCSSVKPYFLQDDHSCTDCNLDGYYKNSQQCSKCNQNCITCSDSSKCSKCSPGYFINASNQCEKCFDPNCLICNGKNQQDCTSCNSVKQYFLQDDHSCTDCNLDGYYKNSQQCSKCNQNCLNCSDSSTCSKCSPGYFINVSNQCEKCFDPNCLICSGKNQQDCTTCNSVKPYFLQDDHSCTDCNLDGYYKNSQQCSKCIQNCITCSDSSTCSMCSPGYFLNPSKQCEKCFDPNCQICSGKNQQDCTSCNSVKSYFLQDDHSCTDCNLDGYYKNSQHCSKCNQNCITCSDSSTCSKCSPGYFINASNQCEKCFDPYCLTCSGKNQQDCTSCNSVKQYFLQDDHSCTDCNLDGYYKNSQQCSKCNQNCLNCSDSSTCSKCSPGYFINVSNQCEKCFDPNCLICSGKNQQDCTSCNSVKSYFLQDDHSCTDCNLDGYYKNSLQCSKCIQNCIACSDSSTCFKCSPGYFINASNQCEKCFDPNCLICSGKNQQDCTSCNSVKPYFLQDDHSCTDCSLDGYYKNSQQCSKCIQDCITCSDSSTCSKCSPGYFINASNQCEKCFDPNCLTCSDDHSCTDCNLNGYYKNSQQCSKCNQNCITCSDSSTCSKCSPGYFINASNQCEKCFDPYCLICSGKNQQDCTSCNSVKQYFLQDDHSCTDCNLDGYYKNSQQCSKCNQNCLNCSDSSTCSKCSPGYFINVSNQCEKCFDPNCLICSGKNQQDCTSCNSVKSYFLQDDHSCTDCNLDGYYKNSLQCSKCIQNCIICSDNSKCSKCSTGYFINASNQCEKCFDSNCLICSGKNQQDCTSCNSVKPYFLQDDHSCTDCNFDGYYKNQLQCSKCIQNCIACSDNTNCSKCSPGYFINASNQCEKCFDPNCLTCSGKNQQDCTTCNSIKQYFLQDDHSCTDCNLDGYYKNSQQCSKCIQNCIICSDNSECSKCSTGYFINASNQCEKCFDPNCLKCSGKNQQDCTSCNSVKPYFLQDDHSCTDCAFNGYFLSSKNCLKCVPNCYNCSNTSTCDLCQPGYQVHEQTNPCVVCSQQSGYYVSGKYCKQCNIACKECSGPSDLDCIKCNQLYFQIDTTSKRCQTCPNDAYLISSEQNCQTCKYQCTLCENVQSSYSMLTIDKNQNSNSNYCLVCSCQQCIRGYILFNQKQCTQRCDSIGSNYIYNSSTNTCDCQQGYNYQVRNPYKNNFDCSKDKGYGYYCDSHNICLQCSENCSSCSDSLTCTKCKEGSYLWQNACYKNCFQQLNIVPNMQKGICECPEGYNLEQLSTPIQGQIVMCQLPLILQYINIYNYLVQSNDITLPTDFSQNLIVITYNRMLTSQEYSSFKFLIDKDTLNLGNQYNITSMSTESQNIKAIVTSQQNRKVRQFTINILGSEINYQIPSTILVSSSYGEQSNSLVSSIQLTQNLQTLTKAFSPDENSVAGKIITLLKQFQILCYISNFVQVLPMVYLIKEYLPPKVNFASLFGATIVFNQTPPPTQISFQSQFIDSSHTQQLKDTLKSFGIKPVSQEVMVSCLFIMIGITIKQMQATAYEDYTIITSSLWILSLRSYKNIPEKQNCKVVKPLVGKGLGNRREGRG
ncbi:hypothetical protein ABPG74_004758 [Tetrahymena malaccensis]